MDGSEVYGALEDEQDDEDVVDSILRLPIPPGSMALRLVRVPNGFSTQLAINTLGYNHAAVSEEEYLLAGLAWLANRKTDKVRNLGKKHYKAVFTADPYRPPFWSKNTDLRETVCVGSS